MYVRQGTRGGAVDAREDENNSQNTNTSNESYGLEEPLSDWLDGSSGPSTGTTVGAGVVTSNGNGIAESAGLSGHGSPTGQRRLRTLSVQSLLSSSPNSAAYRCVSPVFVVV